MSDPGWVVTPKDAPAELAEGYKAPEFIPMAEVIAEYTGLSEQRLDELGGVPDTTSLHSRSHIDDWASFAELAGPEGLKLLAKWSR